MLRSLAEILPYFAFTDLRLNSARMYLFIYVPGIQWPGWLQGRLCEPFVLWTALSKSADKMIMLMVGVACLPVFFMHGIWMCYLQGPQRMMSQAGLRLFKKGTQICFSGTSFANSWGLCVCVCVCVHGRVRVSLCLCVGCPSVSVSVCLCGCLCV